jgi:excisionase family DNA binding protein
VSTTKPVPEAFLTTDEVLAYLQVNLRTVYRLIDAGQLPAVRVGRQWRFRRKDIDAWLDRRAPAPGGAPAGSPPARAVPAGPGRRVLVVDPDGASRDVTSSALRSAGHAVETAPDGLVATERLRHGPFDLVVSELRVPGLDVFAVVREARRATPALRLMIVTGHSSEAAAIEALNFGVGGYLVKPSRPAEIAATAARVLAGRSTPS